MHFKNRLESKRLLKNQYLTIVFTLMTLIVCGYGEELPSNKSIVEKHVNTITSSAATKSTEIGFRSLSLQFTDNTIVNRFRPSIVHVFTTLFDSVYLENRSVLVVSVSMERPVITYSSIFSETLFSQELCVRTIKTSMAWLVTNAESKSVYWSESFSESYQDTIPVSAIPAVQNDNESHWNGTPPSPRLISNILEPGIISLAAAIVIYLFFTVRS